MDTLHIFSVSGQSLSLFYLYKKEELNRIMLLQTANCCSAWLLRCKAANRDNKVLLTLYQMWFLVACLLGIVWLIGGRQLILFQIFALVGM